MRWCGDDVEAVELLASLVAKSLVRSVDTGGSRRFSMLQTIREFATDRLGTDHRLLAETRRAHGAFYADLITDLTPDLDARRRDLAFEELDAEIGNLRTAWRYWVESSDLVRLHAMLDGLWTYHDFRGSYHGAAGLSRDVLAVLATTPGHRSVTRRR